MARFGFIFILFFYFLEQIMIHFVCVCKKFVDRCSSAAPGGAEVKAAGKDNSVRGEAVQPVRSDYSVLRSRSALINLVTGSGRSFTRYFTAQVDFISFINETNSN